MTSSTSKTRRGSWRTIFIQERSQMTNILDRAYSVIILSLDDGVLKEVGGKKIVAGLWKKLEDTYSKKSMAKRLAIKKKLYTL